MQSVIFQVLFPCKWLLMNLAKFFMQWILRQNFFTCTLSFWIFLAFYHSCFFSLCIFNFYPLTFSLMYLLNKHLPNDMQLWSTKPVLFIFFLLLFSFVHALPLPLLLLYILRSFFLSISLFLFVCYLSL